jgi:hypothetical protein
MASQPKVKPGRRTFSTIATWPLHLRKERARLRNAIPTTLKRPISPQTGAEVQSRADILALHIHHSSTRPSSTRGSRNRSSIWRAAVPSGGAILFTRHSHLTSCAWTTRVFTLSSAHLSYQRIISDEKDNKAASRLKKSIRWALLRSLSEARWTTSLAKETKVTTQSLDHAT